MRKLAIFSAAFAAACGIYVWLWQDARALWAAGICLFLAISAMFARTVKLHRFAFALFGISVGIVWCFFYQHTVLGPANRADGTEQTVTMQIVEELFPKDAPIILMCGGGGYAGMMRNLLIFLGWDANLLYTIGGEWEYTGEHPVIYIGNVGGEPEYYLWRAEIVDIDFSLLKRL